MIRNSQKRRAQRPIRPASWRAGQGAWPGGQNSWPGSPSGRQNITNIVILVYTPAEKIFLIPRPGGQTSWPCESLRAPKHYTYCISGVYTDGKNYFDPRLNFFDPKFTKEARQVRSGQPAGGLDKLLDQAVRPDGPASPSGRQNITNIVFLVHTPAELIFLIPKE